MIVIFVLLAIALLLVLKICKKTLKTVLATGIVLASFYCAILSTDINRIENFREPVFTIARNEEAGATEYKGLGYKTIVKYGHTENNEKKINSIEMFMLGKCIAGAIE